MAADWTVDQIQLLDRSESSRDLLTSLRAQVLRPSFPKEQYVDDDDAQHNGPLLIACAPDGLVVGGALGEYFNDSTALLGYIAVRPCLRRRGVGEVLMAAVTANWTRDGRRWFIEIDDPRHHEPHAGHGDPTARVAFYHRFGVRAVPIPYFQPRLNPTLGRGEHMILGIVPSDNCEPIDTIRGADVADFLDEYFVGCEGEGARNDPDVTWLREWCSCDELPLVGLDPDHLEDNLRQIPDDEPPSAQFLARSREDEEADSP